MPALSSSPIHPVVAHLAAAADSDRLAGAGVVAALAKVPDPRDRRGVRHQISAILALAACAVLAGCRSFTAIGEWVANASDQVVTALEVGGRRPCESTIRRTLQRLDGDELDIAIGGWAAAHTTPPAGRRRIIALDGKTVRGSASDAADARHLLAAIDHRTAVVLGQVNVASKTNEIPMFPQLCDRIDDLEGAVITADALHAQRSHADYVVLQRQAHYLLTVKGNQPSLLGQLKALPWKMSRPHTPAPPALTAGWNSAVLRSSRWQPGSCSHTPAKPFRSPARPVGSRATNGPPKSSTRSPACPPIRPPQPNSPPGSAATGP
jgi:hypothetical protein